MTTHRRRADPRRASVAAVLAVLALAASGCSGDDDASSGSPSSVAASPSVSQTSEGSTSPDPSAGARGIPTTVDAQVTRVEGGCVYVAPDDAEDVLALRGDLPDLAVGDTVTVSGAPDDTDYPECPDGAPFLVNEVVPS